MKIFKIIILSEKLNINHIQLLMKTKQNKSNELLNKKEFLNNYFLLFQLVIIILLNLE